MRSRLIRPQRLTCGLLWVPVERGDGDGDGGGELEGPRRPRGVAELVGGLHLLEDVGDGVVGELVGGVLDDDLAHVRQLLHDGQLGGVDVEALQLQRLRGRLHLHLHGGGLGARVDQALDGDALTWSNDGSN